MSQGADQSFNNLDGRIVVGLVVVRQKLHKRQSQNGVRLRGNALYLGSGPF